jgi:hypothetical protein
MMNVIRRHHYEYPEIIRCLLLWIYTASSCHWCTLPDRVLRCDGSRTTSPDCPTSSLRALAMGLKESSPGLGCFDACIRDNEQISHHLGFLHSNLLHGLDVTDSVAEGIDDLDVLDVQDSIPGIAKMFHVVPEALIMLLPDGLECLSSR